MNTKKILISFAINYAVVHTVFSFIYGDLKSTAIIFLKSLILSFCSIILPIFINGLSKRRKNPS